MTRSVLRLTTCVTELKAADPFPTKSENVVIKCANYKRTITYFAGTFVVLPKGFHLEPLVKDTPEAFKGCSGGVEVYLGVFLIFFFSKSEAERAETPTSLAQSLITKMYFSQPKLLITLVISNV